MSWPLAYSSALAATLFVTLPADASEPVAQEASPAPPPAARATAEANAGLLRAYRKEVAFLQAQKASLKKRLADAGRRSASRIETAQKEVDALQSKLVRLTLAADRDEDAVRDAERITAELQDSVDRLHAMVTQARATLGADAVPESESGDGLPVESIAAAFERGTELMRRTATVYQQPGSFYLEDGSQADGTLVHVGAVATYGVSGAVAGALAPAGEGRLRLWPGPTGDVARALQAGDRPEQLGIFLHEGLDAPYEEKEEKTVFEFVAAGGVIAWVIVGLGLLALVMISIRAISLLRTASRADELVEQVAPLVENGDHALALELCRPSRGAVARVLAATIRNRDRDREHMEDIVSEAVLHETPHIERFSAAITVCAAVAPLLGLLGTVTGMISTFEVITEHGTGDPKMLSGGISEALVTTQLGLIVAIPTLLLGTLLSARGQVILQRMERAALRIMNVVDVSPESEISRRGNGGAEPPAPVVVDTPAEVEAGALAQR
jgi:biopolymer transport protein ExbB